MCAPENVLFSTLDPVSPEAKLADERTADADRDALLSPPSRRRRKCLTPRMTSHHFDRSVGALFFGTTG